MFFFPSNIANIVPVDYLEYICIRIEDSWQPSVANMSLSNYAQFLISHFYCGNINSNPSNRKKKEENQ